MNFKNPVILTTEQNICGQNIRNSLLENWNWEPTSETFDGNPILAHENIRLVYSSKDVIDADHTDKLEADLLIYGSRHKSQANKPSLLTHVTGNLGGDNSHGGNPFELSFASTLAIRESYLNLKKQQEDLSLDDFDVTVEATHHGPTNLKTPLIFVEVGSTEKEYNNIDAILAVSRTIIEICKASKNNKLVPCICFGGGHYTTRFNELMELSDIGIGHILPKYQKSNLTEAIVKQMIDKTIEKVKWAIIDRSSLNTTEISIIKNAASTRNVEVIKAKDLKHGKIEI